LARITEEESLTSISKECGITEGTGRNWRKKYLELGKEAKRQTRQRSKVLRRKSRVSKEICKFLVSKENPVRKDGYKVQIKYHNLPVGKRQLQRKLREHTKGSRIYKCAFIKKQISAKNKKEREVYSEKHLYDPLFRFFDHIVFTDEAHVDPIAQRQGEILREEGTRDDPDNIEERPPLKGVRFHIAAWISW
jgi:hypothetical protein